MPEVRTAVALIGLGALGVLFGMHLMYEHTRPTGVYISFGGFCVLLFGLGLGLRLIGG